MNKRQFLKTTATVATASIVLPTYLACNDASQKEKTKQSEASKEKTGTTNTVFTLPALPYAFNALAPNIDAQTMEIHHDRHHAGYVKKLNKAVDGTKFAHLPLEQLLAQVTDKDTGVRNNGGGHYNHSLFWETIAPNAGGTPTGQLADALNATFGDYDKFKAAFFKAAKSVFGSGWAWLCVGNDRKLFISATPNQDNPLMTHLVKETGQPILGIDVWEHAYYLNYQNRRGDYINNFFNIINWEKVAQNLSDAAKK